MPKKVMIIDDEPDIRTYLMAALEDNGYAPCTLDESGAVATLLTAVKNEMPDLIVLDIMMPGRSGISIYKEIKSVPQLKDISVALISGLETSKEMMTTDLIDLIDDGKIEPPDGFIEKPVRLDAFLELVGNLLS